MDANKLTTIDDFSFRSLTSLREISLIDNHLSDNKTNILFKDLDKLEELYLSSNKLEKFPIISFKLFLNLRKVDLSHNNIQFFDYRNYIFHSVPNLTIDLSSNNIRDFKIKDVLNYIKIQQYKNNEIHFIISDNPLNCDCKSLELIQFVKKQIEPQSIYKVFDLEVNNLYCQQPEHLMNRHVTSLNTSELVCDIKKNCPVGCQCYQRPVDDTIIFNCSSFEHQQFPTLPKYIYLNLTSIELNVTNSQIQSIHLKDIPDHLALLDVRSNSLEYLKEEVIERFKTIEKLYLSGNAWTCNCDAVKFIKFYQTFRSKIMDADDMICLDGRPFITLNTRDLCIQWIKILVVFSTVTSIIGLFSVFYLLNKKKIKMWLYAHNCCLWWVSEEEADKDMIYDAFFVFSHFDDNFVTDLILDLELKAFKCCVHHRDWPAGEMIVTLVRTLMLNFDDDFKLLRVKLFLGITIN